MFSNTVRLSAGMIGSEVGGSAHRYWRLVGTVGTPAYWEIVEIKFFDAGNEISNVGTEISSDISTANKAFDGMRNTYWYRSYTAGGWIGRDFGSDVVISSFAIQARDYYDPSRQIPRYIDLEWSDDGVDWNYSGFTADTENDWQPLEMKVWETGL